MATGHSGRDEPLVDLAQSLIAAALSLPRAQDQDPRQGALEFRRIVDQVHAPGAGAFPRLALRDAH
jgi:hypothetical protein